MHTDRPQPWPWKHAEYRPQREDAMTSKEIESRINKALGVVMREMPKFKKAEQKEYTASERSFIMEQAGEAFILAFNRYPAEMNILVSAIKADNIDIPDVLKDPQKTLVHGRNVLDRIYNG